MATRITIPVSGMHCAACQSRVQEALAGTPGVSDATVNLMLNNAMVTYDEDVVKPAALIASIKSTGYDAALPTSGSGDTTFAEQERQDRAQSAEVGELTRKTWVSLAVAAIAMTLHMIAPRAAAVPWILLALATLVVVWTGRHFYARAWRAFRHHTADMNTLIAVGTGTAYVYSVVATVAPRLFEANGVQPELYYEAVAAIIGLILLGNTFEARARRQTTAALRGLAELQPKTVRVLRDLKGRSTSRSLRSSAATSSSCAPASGSPPTARWCRARARWTNRCSPANRCRWPRRRAIGSSAARSIAPGRSKPARRRSARTARSRASSN